MKFCVIGLGYFGTHMVQALTALGAEVMAVDSDEEHVEAVKDIATYAAIIDASKTELLRKLPLRDMDAVIVAIGEDFESSLMVTAHLRKLDVKRIICRVINPVHDELLELMGISERLVPEAVAANRLAKSLMFQGVINNFDLGDGFSILETIAPDKVIGKTLAQSRLREDHGVNLVTIRKAPIPGSDVTRRGTFFGVVQPSYVFEKGDILVLFGQTQDLEKFLKG